MANVSGNQLVAQALQREGIDTLFFIMGGPMLDVEAECIKLGIKAIDFRHEQACVLAAIAYARLTGKIAACAAASGPGVTNQVTGVAHALVDGAPVLVLGGASPVYQWGTDAFQEIDQVAMMRPISQWAERVVNTERIPEVMRLAMHHALHPKPGPAYVDLPGDILYKEVDESRVNWPVPPKKVTRPTATDAEIEEAIQILASAERPIIVSGSGIIWSQASPEFEQFVDTTGIPFWTTPQGRGVVPEDHPLCFLNARSTAWREADVALIIGTRNNYVISFGREPRFAKDLRVVQVNIDPGEIGHNRPVDLGIIGDAKIVLQQMIDAAKGRLNFRDSAWVRKLREINVQKQEEMEAKMATDQVPIHPLRLCKEVRDFLDRDAVLIVDGQETLNYGRQSIPTFVAGHRMNSGPFGTMGVNVPLGVGAKFAKPDKQVLVLTGDGSFGMNAMEMDTAIRHKLNLVTVISNNGGWTADPTGTKPGRNLGFTRYDKMVEGLGGYGEWVERPEDIRPALERAFKAGVPALVNVKTDDKARAVTARFAQYST